MLGAAGGSGAEVTTAGVGATTPGAGATNPGAGWVEEEAGPTATPTSPLWFVFTCWTNSSRA